jgi:SAM-dependent methyltransferase
MKKVNRFGIEKRCRIINSLPGNNNGGRLLDIGCSTGLFINLLRQTGTWEVRGIEPSEYAVKIARENYKLDVYNGSLSDANYPTAYFDVVTLWDVLEHLPDPSGTLEEISRITKPQGHLVIRVPNYDSLDAKIFGAEWAGLDLPRHYYVFSKNNIHRIFERNDYLITTTSGAIGAYPTFVLSIRFWLTSHSVDRSIRTKIIWILNHPISKLLSAPFFYFYGLFLLGSEITVIAKKKQ